MLFHAFRKFRNNVDLMTARVAASYLNLAFGHVLGRVEQLRENNPTDAGLLPLHRMTSEWIERLVEHYRGGFICLFVFSYRTGNSTIDVVFFLTYTGITSSTATRG